MGVQGLKKPRGIVSGGVREVAFPAKRRKVWMLLAGHLSLSAWAPLSHAEHVGGAGTWGAQVYPVAKEPSLF